MRWCYDERFVQNMFVSFSQKVESVKTRFEAFAGDIKKLFPMQ